MTAKGSNQNSDDWRRVRPRGLAAAHPQQAAASNWDFPRTKLAFYDALETNDSAVQVLGDETLRDIACELVDTVRNNVTIDWTLRENVRANLRRLVRRILRQHGYPPDKQEKATKTSAGTSRGPLRRLGRRLTSALSATSVTPPATNEAQSSGTGPTN